ncbi:MAG: glycosyl hydrolase 108 family protein [Byssovorax sp.]
MASTANDKKDIATKGTLHVAFATAPDMCKVPALNMMPFPFPNWVLSKKLTKGATTKSFIAGFPVWTSIGELGPPSEPAHFGTGGGVKSGTYRDVATPTSYSKDVFFEGNAAVRLNDTTNQNKANTTGLVLYGPTLGIFAKADDYDFQIALKRVLKYEGGLDDDPDDAGGRTNKGITHTEYDKYRDEKKLPRQDIANISDDEVADIYKKKYWDKAGSADLTPKLGQAHFDWAVNHGLGGSESDLRSVLNPKPGETLGQAEQRLLNSGTTEDTILDNYLKKRESTYRAILEAKPSQVKFINGWLNRTNDLRSTMEVPGDAAVLLSKTDKAPYEARAKAIAEAKAAAAKAKADAAKAKANNKGTPAKPPAKRR